jgi:hypothetical protein
MARTRKLGCGSTSAARVRVGALLVGAVLVMPVATNAQPAPAAQSDGAATTPPANEAAQELAEDTAESEALVDEEHEDDEPGRRQCTAQDVLRGLCTNAEAARASAEKIWRLMARAELVMPVVFDDTPETELLAYYYLGAELDLPFLLSGLYATAWLGLAQKFWRIEGEPSVDFEDPLIGLGYRHSIALGAEHDLVLVHRLGAYFPAARDSRANLYYTTVDWLTAARYPFEIPSLGAFTVGVNVWAQYLFRQYDTQLSDGIGADFDGPGGANTRMRLEGGGLLQYTIFDSASAGNLLTQFSTGYRHRVRYDGSAQPDWYWALGATYTPIPYLSATLSLEHGYSDILRGGSAYFVAFNRDETAWRFALFGRY